MTQSMPSLGALSSAPGTSSPQRVLEKQIYRGPNI